MLKLLKTLSIPLVITNVFILSCFMPIVQGVILTYNGGLLALVNWLAFLESPVRVGATNWTVNFTLSILFLLLFYKATSLTGRVIFSILSFIFLFCFFVFATGDTYGETEPYFMYFIVVCIITGIILCSIAILKNKLRKT